MTRSMVQSAKFPPTFKHNFLTLYLNLSFEFSVSGEKKKKFVKDFKIEEISLKQFILPLPHDNL